MVLRLRRLKLNVSDPLCGVPHCVESGAAQHDHIGLWCPVQLEEGRQVYAFTVRKMKSVTVSLTHCIKQARPIITIVSPMRASLVPRLDPSGLGNLTTCGQVNKMLM